MNEKQLNTLLANCTEDVCVLLHLILLFFPLVNKYNKHAQPKCITAGC